MQVIFILAGFVLFFGQSSWFPAYYRPKPMALISFLYAFIIEFPSLVLKRESSTEKRAAKVQFQVALAVGLLLCGLGSLGLWGLYQIDIPYDKFVHFTFSVLMTVAGTYIFRYWSGLSLKRSLLVAVAIVGLSGVGWEYIEAFFAHYFHVGFFGRLFDHDSRFDIYTNLLGAGAGAAIVGWQRWAKKHL